MLRAYTNSSARVSLEVKLIAVLSNPIFLLMTSSVSVAQSTPQPSSFKILRIAGLGVALTAKNSLKPGFHEKAAFTARAVSRMPFSS